MLEADAVLQQLARITQRQPGLIAVVVYRLDSAGDMARLVAGALPTGHDGLPVPGAAPRQALAVAAEPILQQVLAGEGGIATPADVLPFAAGEPATSSLLRGATAYWYPVTGLGRPVGAVAVIGGPSVTVPQATDAVAPLLSAADSLLATVRRLERLDVLGRITQMMAVRPDVDLMLQDIITAAQELSGADRAVFWEYHEGHGALERRAMTGLPNPAARLGERVPADHTVHGLAIQQGRPIFIPDVARDTLLPPFGKALLTRTGIQSIYAVPVAFEGRVIGSIGITFTQTTTRDPDLLELAKYLARCAAVCLHNARQYREIVRRSREVEALHRISRTVTSQQDMSIVLQEIAHATLEGLQADRVSLWRYHADDDAIELCAVAGLAIAKDPEMLGKRLAMTTGALRRTIRDREIVTLNDTAMPVEGDEERGRQFQALGLRSWCCRWASRPSSQAGPAVSGARPAQSARHADHQRRCGARRADPQFPQRRRIPPGYARPGEHHRQPCGSRHHHR